MAASQAEFNAFKAEVVANISKLETAAMKSNADAVAAQTALAELQQGYGQISLQAAPWSAAISSEVAASEAKATEALSRIQSLYEVTKAEVEELRRRATEMEKKSPAEKKAKWELSRPKDMEPDTFGSKEEAWARWKDGVMDYAEAVHSGLREQLEWALKQKEPITHEVMRRSDAGCSEDEWTLRTALYTLLKRKTEVGSEARKFVECVEKEDGYEAWRLLGGRYEANLGTKRFAMLAELTMLQNKRCKSPAETAMIVLEIDRRKKIIMDTGGRAPDEDVCQNVL